MNVNKMDISFPNQVQIPLQQQHHYLSFNHYCQLFIDGLFCDATSGKKLRSIDPRNEELICEVIMIIDYRNDGGSRWWWSRPLKWSIDPHDEEIIIIVEIMTKIIMHDHITWPCWSSNLVLMIISMTMQVESASSEDVDRACKAAQRAFEGRLCHWNQFH